MYHAVFEIRGAKVSEFPVPATSKQGRPCKRAEINPAVSFHILRHSYATLLLESNGSRGMSIRDVAALLGDTVATCEKHYGHVIQDALKREVARKLPSFGAVEVLA